MNMKISYKKTVDIIVVGLMISSIALQGYSLSMSFRSIASLSSDLFEMFRPLNYPYFLGGVLLIIAVTIYYLSASKVSRANVVLSLYIASLLMYKLLPKYVYYLPLQREIYHTANIMYVYDHHSIDTPGYPSMPDSVGYAIFYAVLGWVLGLNKQVFINFLAIFTDLFHLIIIVIISLAVIKRNGEPFRRWSFLILSIPVIFMLQINTTYRNGFASLLMTYIIATLCMARSEAAQSKQLIFILTPLLLAAAISYPGVIPLFTVGMVLYVSIHVIDSFIFEKKSFGAVWGLYSITIANTAWFFWQLSRYPKIYNAIRMYVNSLLELISGKVEPKALTTRYAIYTRQYSILLTLRAIYALILIGVLGTLVLITVFMVLKGYRKRNSNTLIATSFAIALSSFIIIGARGNFHFAAVYNMFSSASAILIATLLSSNSLSEFLNKTNITKKLYQIKGGLQAIMVFAFCIFMILSPIALWPAFKNLMPLEAKEVHMFRALATFAMDEAEVGYLGLYGSTISTAIQHVFAERADLKLLGIPYPIENAPSYKLVMIARNIISSQSKVLFNKPLTLWLDNYLVKLHTKYSFNKVVDFGDHYEILYK